MSKRAEEKALEAYPKECGKAFHSAFGTIEFDRNAPERQGYQKGYEQAEKDLALTWEDVRKIIIISVKLANERFVNFFEEQTISDEEHYTEVIKRFNELKQRND